MDTGAVIRQATTPIRDEDDQITLTTRLAELGAQLLVATIPEWLAGTIAPQPQDAGLATLTRPTDRSDGVIDWEAPAVEIWRQIRAFAEWPQGSTRWNGKHLRILRARSDETATGTPGLVAPWGPPKRSPDAAAIGTGRGVLIPEMVVLEGKRPMTIDAFLRGQPAFIGSHLGGE
jgi:methionyl-tRNA formyltransferase